MLVEVISENDKDQMKCRHLSIWKLSLGADLQSKQEQELLAMFVKTPWNFW